MEGRILVPVAHERQSLADCIANIAESLVSREEIGVVTRDRSESRELAARLGVNSGLVGCGVATGLLEEIKEWFEGLTSPGAPENGSASNIASSLESCGIAQSEAERCAEQVQRGAVLITVRASVAKARAVNDRLSGCGLWVAAISGEGVEGARRMPLVEEQLNVLKRPVQRGEVMVAKDVVEEPRQLHVRVLHEEATIERRAANREADEGVGEVTTVRIPLREERVELVRRPRVVEELVVRKRVVTEEREITGTVRK